MPRRRTSSARPRRLATCSRHGPTLAARVLGTERVDPVPDRRGEPRARCHVVGGYQPCLERSGRVRIGGWAFAHGQRKRSATATRLVPARHSPSLLHGAPPPSSDAPKRAGVIESGGISNASSLTNARARADAGAVARDGVHGLGGRAVSRPAGGCRTRRQWRCPGRPGGLRRFSGNCGHGRRHPDGGRLWKAGCQVSGYDSSDNVYIYTLWQVFTTNGTTITSKSPPTYSSWSGQGWVLTNAPAPTGWWVTTNKKWAAQGNFTYTQYFFGFPVKSSSGWVEITVNYNGTWSCLNG